MDLLIPMIDADGGICEACKTSEEVEGWDAERVPDLDDAKIRLTSPQPEMISRLNPRRRR